MTETCINKTLVSYSQAFSFENTRRVNNGSFRIK